MTEYVKDRAIVEAILRVAAEIKLFRLLLADVIDQGTGEQFPGYIRTKDISTPPEIR